MIAIEMTVAEMVNLCSNVSVDSGLRKRLVSALEKAVASTGDEQYKFNLMSYNPKNKIDVIKVVRLAFGWGLKESKEWVEKADVHNNGWCSTPWMEYNRAFDLREALIRLGCTCDPIVKYS